MPCNCQTKQWYKQQILRREHTIALLKQINQKELQHHQITVQQMTQSIQEYEIEKNIQSKQYFTQIQRLRGKLDHYKLKCCKLNQQIKEDSDKIKFLTSKKLSLQLEINKLRELLDVQNDKQMEATKYKNEMKQIISLQQLQNQQLAKKCTRLKQQIEYMRKQITNFSEIKDKFANVQNISDDQYRNQLTLLKNKLQYQFCKTTNQILSQITEIELNETKKNMKRSDQCRQTTKDGYLSNISQEYQELRKIANYIDYGHEYFLLDSRQLKLPQSTKIFKFISIVIQQRLQTQRQLAQQIQITNSISDELKQQIQSLQEQFKDMNSKNFVSRQTQTVDNSKISDVISINSSLKLKVYQLHNMITLVCKFVAFTLNFAQIYHQKQRYYHFTQKMLYYNVVGKSRGRFRKVAISVLFIEVLNKKRRSIKRLNIQHHLQRQNINNYVSSQYLQRHFYNFFISLKRNSPLRNYKIDQILKQKFEFSSEVKLIQIINQQILNSANKQNKFSDLFSRFYYEVQHKLKLTL